MIAYDRLIEDPNAFYITFDNVEVWPDAGARSARRGPGRHYVMNSRVSNTDPNSDFLRGGQQEVLQAAIDSGAITIVGETYTDGWLPANAQRNMEQILVEVGNDVDAVVARRRYGRWRCRRSGAVGLDGILPVSGRTATMPR